MSEKEIDTKPQTKQPEWHIYYQNNNNTTVKSFVYKTEKEAKEKYATMIGIVDAKVLSCEGKIEQH